MCIHITNCATARLLEGGDAKTSQMIRQLYYTFVLNPDGRRLMLGSLASHSMHRTRSEARWAHSP
jgi:hypothetical protein